MFLDFVLFTFIACLNAPSSRNSREFSIYKASWSDDWDMVLSVFALNLNLSLFDIDSLSFFFSEIWKWERLGHFVGLPFPITAMGFEPAIDSEVTNRCWYKFQGKKYYIPDCDFEVLDPKANPVLFEDWAKYLPQGYEDEKLVLVGEE